MTYIHVVLIPGENRSITTYDAENNPTNVEIANQVDFDFTVDKLITGYSGNREYSLFVSGESSVSKIELVSPNLGEVTSFLTVPLGLNMHPDIALDTFSLNYLINLT